MIAILEKGKLVNLVDLPGRLMAVFVRDGGIHVFSYSRYTSDTGFDSATWSAITVAADGSHNEAALEQEPFSRPWNEVGEFHGKTLDSFGVRGWTNVNAAGKDEGVELLWRWNRAKKAYVLKKRSIPVEKGRTHTP